MNQKNQNIIQMAIMITCLCTVIVLFVIWSIAQSDFETEEIIVKDTDINNTLDQTTIKAGQIWIYESKNPFRSISSIYYVIEVKQKYVKYCEIIDDKYDIAKWQSDSVNMFKTGSRRIK